MVRVMVHPLLTFLRYLPVAKSVIAGYGYGYGCCREIVLSCANREWNLKRTGENKIRDHFVRPENFLVNNVLITVLILSGPEVLIIF